MSTAWSSSSPAAWCSSASPWLTTSHPWWIGLAIFAGLNMIQAAFTGFCPAAMLFKKLGAKPGVAFR